MDNSLGPKRKAKEYPRVKANVISKIFFGYIIPLFRNGFKKDLTERDLYEIPRDFKAKTLGDQLENEWEKQMSAGKPALIYLLWNAYGKTYFLLGFFQLFISVTVLVIQPLAIGKFISYFSAGQNKITKAEAWYYAVLVIAVNFIQALFNSKIVTLITKDVQIFGNFAESANDIWIGVIKTLVALYLLGLKVGVIVLVPIIANFLVIPIHFYLGRCIARLRVKICRKTDERLQNTKEALNAIKVIKMYTWEKFFLNQINVKRREEIKLTIYMYILRLAAVFVGILSKGVSFYGTILVYAWMGNLVTGDVFYFILRCFQILAYTMTELFPNGVAQVAEFYAALKRISFVINHGTSKLKTSENSNNKHQICLKDVSIENDKQLLLQDVNITLNPGINLLTGSVGSGKTTLLKTIIGDIIPNKGTVTINGQLSYASQMPWLFPSTIKQNIIFGQAYNRMRYQDVIQVCALKYDLDCLQDGDETIIEDNGSNLSVGQQARINLARALYREADIYLLDDCLAALDPQIADYIFEKGILQFLANKLVLMVSYNYITKCENVLIIDDTKVIVEKKSETCAANFTKYLNNHQNQELKYKINNLSCETADCDKNNELAKLLDDIAPKNQIYYESQKQGQVEYGVYHKFIKFGGGYFACFAVILVFLVSQINDTHLDKFVGDWINSEEIYSNYTYHNATETQEFKEATETRHYFLIFNVIIVPTTIFLWLFRAICVFAFTRKVSLDLHKKMIAKVMYSTIEFFDNNFLGNILNRFSKDLLTIDEQIPFVLLYTFIAGLSLIGVIVLIAIINVMFLIPTALFFVMLILFRRIYLPTSRSLKRLDAATRAPVIGYLNSTLEGLTTIKATNIDNTLIKEFDEHQDLYTSANYTLHTCIKTFTLWLDSLCTLFVAVLISRFLIFDKDTLGGYVGLILSQAFSMTERLEFGIRQWAELENQMTSVERALHYTQIKQEPQQMDINTDWPKSGDIEYKHVFLKYPYQNEWTLNNINFHITNGEKIGIVGRTGAGKSSLLSTFFRLYDVEGEIFIDGIEIKSLPLKCLRSKISIIPQNPILFTGTIRENIDPEGIYSDEQISAAISAAHLNSFIKDLNYKIEIGGMRLSAGQKQLICVARAIIKQNKIIVLDEATANLDPLTDSLIQEVLANNFKTCTVLVIAHRLHTILDCDRIMVISKGQIKEFDSPDNLKQYKNGLFKQMLERHEELISM